LGFRLRQHNLQFLPGVKRSRLFCPCIKLSNVPFLLLPVQNKEYGGQWAPFFLGKICRRTIAIKIFLV
jgi:hypothetical protein